jgi:hypothetical protein
MHPTVKVHTHTIQGMEVWTPAGITSCMPDKVQSGELGENQGRAKHTAFCGDY